MKTSKSFSGVALVITLLMMVASSAVAGNSRTITTRSPIIVNGTEIPAGQYTIKWQSHSPEATVTFIDGGRTVATAEGKWVERETASASDAILYRTTDDGTRILTEMRFAGMKRVLVYGE